MTENRGLRLREGQRPDPGLPVRGQRDYPPGAVPRADQAGEVHSCLRRDADPRLAGLPGDIGQRPAAGRQRGAGAGGQAIYRGRGISSTGGAADARAPGVFSYSTLEER